MVSLTRDIKHNGKAHRFIKKELERRINMSERGFSDLRKDWSDAENEIIAWIPEKETDQARRTDREINGDPQYTTIKVPYSYAVTMASHTYWTSVFLSRTPPYQYEGRHGESQNKVLAMEALVDYQMRVGKMLPNLYSWLFDAGRYGVAILGTYWEEEVCRFTEILEEFDVDPVTGAETSTGQTFEQTSTVKGYEGNKTFNVRPHDFLSDPRVSIVNFQDGEFCGLRRILSWNQIVKRAEKGYYTNLDDIKSNIREKFPDSFEDSALRRPTDSDREDTYRLDRSDENRIKHPEYVPLYEMYIDIIPKEWNISSSTYPEKWVFTITADLNTIIGAQPLGARHCMFPFSVIEIEPDQYSIANRGIPKILDPISRTMDWLINTHFYNVRATLNNQFVLDPSRVVMKDALDPLPGNMIRLKPSAYGTNVNEAIKQLQVQDVTQQHLSDMQPMLGLGERVLGVNDQLLGVVNESSRRSATEVRSSNTFGVNRLKTVSEYMSAVGFASHSQLLVQNSQQFYDQDLKLKIVGNTGSNIPDFMNVDPDSITGFYDYVPVDGTLPIDRIAQANLLKDVFQTVATVPEIAQGYDLPKLFGWMVQNMGIRNIDSFKVQVVPDGQNVPGSIPVSPGQINGGNSTQGQLGPANPVGRPVSVTN